MKVKHHNEYPNVGETIFLNDGFTKSIGTITKAEHPYYTITILSSAGVNKYLIGTKIIKKYKDIAHSFINKPMPKSIKTNYTNILLTILHTHNYHLLKFIPKQYLTQHKTTLLKQFPYLRPIASSKALYAYYTSQSL